MLQWIALPDLCRWRPLHRGLERHLARRGLAHTQRPAPPAPAPGLSQWRRGALFRYWRGTFGDLAGGTLCRVLDTVRWDCPEAGCAARYRGLELRVAPVGSRGRSYSHLFLYDRDGRRRCRCRARSPPRADLLELLPAAAGARR